MTITSSATLEAADPDLAATVLAGLDAVETRLHEVVRSSHPLLTEASSHLVLAGGKRVRPLLTLVAGHLGDASSPGLVDAAVVVELTHLATLYHDDVMDEAAVRRGAQSANARYGNTVAILTGDYLFARASDLTAGLGTEVTRLQSQTFARLVEGQIAETAGPLPGTDPVQHHLRVVADKTGSLIATSARLGAMVAGADPADIEAVALFGEVFGVAFQLSDDLIDIASESAESGKTPGTDLREGVPTLPVLLVLADDGPGAADLRALLTGDLSDDGRLAEALAGLRAHPAMEQARARLDAHVADARRLAGSLSSAPVRAALLGLAGFLSARTG